MRIELFGIARARAGTGVVVVDAATLGAAMRALQEACPSLAPEVIADGRLTDGFLASLNGHAFVRDESTALAGSDSLLILGAQMGG